MGKMERLRHLGGIEELDDIHVYRLRLLSENALRGTPFIADIVWNGGHRSLCENCPQFV